MVQKSTLFDKLKNRWRPASGIRVDSTKPQGSGRSAANSSPNSDRVAGTSVPMATPGGARVESVSSRKLSSKQEAVVALDEGFKELSSLMRGMQSRMDGHAESLAQLPALNQTQIDLMRSMVERLDQQSTATEVLGERLGDMPKMFEKLNSSLEKVAATDQRTASTLGEFKDNMTRIQACLLYTSPSPRDRTRSRMPSSA